MRIGRTAAVLALAATTVLGLTSTASAQSLSSDHLNRGYALMVGDSIESDTQYGHARLVMQADGNLVLYGNNWGVCWASHTNGSGAYQVIYQFDGNFVLYNRGYAVWASHTMNTAGSNVNINWQGEVWVGVTRLTGACG